MKPTNAFILILISASSLAHAGKGDPLVSITVNTASGASQPATTAPPPVVEPAPVQPAPPLPAPKPKFEQPVTTAPTPPPQVTQPVTTAPVLPPADPKPTYPKCSVHPNDVKNMSQDILGTNMVNRTWIEDQNKDGRTRLKVYSTDPMMVELFDSTGESVGVAKFTTCVDGGKIVAHLSMTGLNFGLFSNLELMRRLKLTQGDASQILFDITKGPNGKVRISDRMVGYAEHVDNNFSAAAAAK